MKYDTVVTDHRDAQLALRPRVMAVDYERRNFL